MKLTKKEIQSLRVKKNNIQMTIFSYVQSKQDASELVKEYHRIVEMLVDGGAKVYIRAPYLKLEYWGLTPSDVHNIKPPKKEIKCKQKSNQTYKLKFVYNNKTDSNLINTISNYFDNLGLTQEKEIDFEDTNSKTIYIKKYMYNGSDEGFNIIKKSSQAILDIINTNNDADLEVFGKKLG